MSSLKTKKPSKAVGNTFNCGLEKDNKAKIAEFVHLSRTGHYQDADALYKKYFTFNRDLYLYAVAAEYGDHLLRQSQFQQLRGFAMGAQFTFNNSEESAVFHLMRLLAEFHLKLSSQSLAAAEAIRLWWYIVRIEHSLETLSSTEQYLLDLFLHVAAITKSAELVNVAGANFSSAMSALNVFKAWYRILLRNKLLWRAQSVLGHLLSILSVSETSKLLLEFCTAIEGDKHIEDETMVALASLIHQYIPGNVAATGQSNVNGERVGLVDSKIMFGSTLLHLAAAEGDTNKATSVLKIQVSTAIDLKDRYGQTPLSLAAAGAHVEIIKLLLERADASSISRETYCQALRAATHKGHVRVVSILLRHIVDYYSRRWSHNSASIDETMVWSSADEGDDADTKLANFAKKEESRETDPGLRGDHLAHTNLQVFDQADTVDVETGGADETGEDPEYTPPKRSRRAVIRRSMHATTSVPLSSNAVYKNSPRHNEAITRRPVTSGKQKLLSSSVQEDSPTKQSALEIESCSFCGATFASPSILHKHILSTHTRPFTCTFSRYGCTGIFGSKNEWKRHVSSQHLRLGIFRCDLGVCARQTKPQQKGSSASPTKAATSSGFNDFNRKDLFTQHLRRMHSPVAKADKKAFDSSFEDIRSRCWVKLHDLPPRSMCGFCLHAGKEVIFEEKDAWDARMEHVSRHLEKGDNDEDEDHILRGWLIEQGLLQRDRQSEWVVVGIGGKEKKTI